MTKTGSVLLVGSGENYNENKLKEFHKKSDIVIAVDGGYDILVKHNLKFDILLGDFDSINANHNEIEGNFEKLIYPQEKDFSDSELAIMKALEYYPEKIYLFNMTGTYFDHTLANIYNIFKYQTKSTQIVIVTNNSLVFGLEKGIYELDNYLNRRASFFFLEPVKDLSISGFKYNYKKNDLTIFDYSLSNIIIEDRAKLSFEEGKIIFVIFDESYK